MSEINNENTSAQYDNIINENKKIKSHLKVSRIINLVLTAFLTFFVVISLIVVLIVVQVYTNIKPHFNALLGKNYNIASISIITDKNQLEIENFTRKLAFLDDIVNMLYYYDKDNKKIEDAMFSGYMKGLNDKYAEYYSKSDFDDFTEKTTEGVYYGIGCLVNQNPDNLDCIVNLVYEDSPAEVGGLMKDDIFVSVNGEHVRGIELNELISKIRGEEGAKRVIEVYRPSTESIVELTVYCGKVDIKLINSEIIENDIGYLDVDEFTGKAAEQFKIEIDKLMSKDIKSLIIDLRDNPGGELMTVCEMMDYILRDTDGKYTLNQKENLFDEGKTLLVYIKEKDQIVDAAYCDDKHSVELPIVILTNLNTASAAELFTECMRDYNKAKVVGLKTFGKGVVQNVIPYEDGSAFKFTVSEYFPPSGYSIDKKGILPDYSLDYFGGEVEYDEDNNILVDDDNVVIAIDSEGNIISEKAATKSNVTLSTSSDADNNSILDSESEDSNHIENLKIYDLDNKFVDEEWFQKLDEKYDDKQLLQAIVILND
mgnify:CR=1 FL=1